MDEPRQLELMAPVRFTIEVRGNRATIQGNYPRDIVRQAASFFVDGYQYSPKYKERNEKGRRKWDGRCYLCDRTGRRFPAGLTGVVRAAVLEASPASKVSWWVEDDGVRPIGPANPELEGVSFGAVPYDYQIAAVAKAISARRGILKIAPGGGKTEIFLAIVRSIGLPALIVEPNCSLLRQTQQRASLRLGIPVDEIGVLGDGEKRVGALVTVAIPDTLLPFLEEAKGVRDSLWPVVLVDEVHHLGSDRWYKCLSRLRASWRIGGSGTPLDRADGAELKLIAQTGRVIFDVPFSALISRGVCVPAEITVVMVRDEEVVEDGFMLPGERWQSVHREAVILSPRMADAVLGRAKFHSGLGRRTLALVRTIEHGERLCCAARDAGVRSLFVQGKDGTAERQQALSALAARELDVLFSTGIFDEGIDVPEVEAVVFADSCRSKIQALQRIGRGLRRSTGKERVWVDDVFSTAHRWFMLHALDRLKAYESEGFSLRREEA